VVFAGLMLALLLAALDGTIVATALPTIVGEMGGLGRLGWVVTSYLLAQTVVTPLYGKLGDLYGRKRVLQTAVVAFLLGSALCGLSRSLTQLIIFRFIQGLGGGGLMVTAQAVVGDIVPPRDRGRYQGLFGAVFGLASIAGPLIGGFFTTHLSWRWIFYVNLPLGGAALGVIAVALPATGRRARHSVDYVGAALLAAALSGAVLVTDLGGGVVGWRSPAMLALSGLTLAAFAGFLRAERRAAEPVLPLRLFRIADFSIASAIGFIVGFALFGATTYLPLFLQVSKGSSPTTSGLQMLPMMAGMLTTSIASGQIISRTARYRIFPRIGTALIAVGLVVLSRLTADTSVTAAMGAMLMLGLGLGCVMQVLVIASQNTVGYADLGVATSAATLARLVGGSLGTAALGAVFAAGLPPEFEGLVTPASLSLLPPAERAEYAVAVAESLGTVFGVAAGVAAIGIVLAWVLPERRLRETIAAAGEDAGGDSGGAFAMPAEAESLPQLLRGLSVVADRDMRRKHIELITRRAGVDLSPAAAWALIRLDRDAHVDRAGLAELARDGLVVSSDGTGAEPRYRPSRQGCELLERLCAARRAHLAELFGEWDPASHAELAELLGRLSGELVPEPRSRSD
jgi:EmrB/QacA subfamily drug resistance transporter